MQPLAGDKSKSTAQKPTVLARAVRIFVGSGSRQPAYFPKVTEA
jgi:hypothetical protein